MTRHTSHVTVVTRCLELRGAGVNNSFKNFDEPAHATAQVRDFSAGGWDAVAGTHLSTVFSAPS